MTIDCGINIWLIAIRSYQLTGYSHQTMQIKKSISRDNYSKRNLKQQGNSHEIVSMTTSLFRSQFDFCPRQVINIRLK